MSKRIAKVVVGLPVEGPFDYSVPEEMQVKISVGMRVLILFNRRKMLGYVVGFASRSAFKRLNPILSLLEEKPSLTENFMALAESLHKHYGCSLGEAIEAMLPAFLRKKKAYANDENDSYQNSHVEPVEISNLSYDLLVDPSLTLRWQNIFPRMETVLRKGKSVLCLFPENRLIKSAQQRIASRISNEIVVLDKKIPVSKEEPLWKRIQSKEAKIVMGTRSAVFSPLRNLGLIVVFDEENRSYKQEQTPYYHACEIAQMRAKIDGAEFLSVSSAPSAETWYKFKSAKYVKTELISDEKNEMKLVDLTNFNPRKTSRISFPLQANIEKTLREKGKVLLFMNRKGFFTMTSCNECGHVLKCERCDVNLTYHFAQKMLVCKHCNFTQALPSFCPSCKGAYLRSRGAGMEKLESELVRLYPLSKVGHFDKDSKNYPSKADIVIATQAVLGVQDKVQAQLVGVINFDAELNHFDFRSAQRAYSLLMKLRQMAKETLIVQTSLIDDYTIRAALKMDHAKFYREELTLRKQIGLPPFQRLVYIIARGKQEDEVFNYCQDLYSQLNRLLEKPQEVALKTFKPKKIEISEPHPDIHPKLRDNYRFCIMMKGPALKNLLALAKEALKKKRGKRSIITAVIVDY